MTFYTKNRKLVSSSGYIKSLVDNTIYDHEIYLGIYDEKANYVEATEADFNAYNDAVAVEALAMNEEKQ